MRPSLRRWIIALHTAYCRPRYIPVVWSLMILTMILQVVLAALGNQ